MWEAIIGGLQRQPWHHSIIYTEQWPKIAEIGRGHGGSINGIIDFYITNCLLEHFKWLNRQNATLGRGNRHHCSVIIWGEEWVTSQSLVSHWSKARWSNVKPHNIGFGGNFSTKLQMWRHIIRDNWYNSKNGIWGKLFFHCFSWWTALTVKVRVI